MKTLFTIFLAGIIFYGCSSNSPVNPEAGKNFSYQKIKMPQPKDLRVETELVDQERIVGNLGGDLEIVGSYESIDGEVTVQAELIVPAGSYKGAKVLTLKHEGFYVDVELSPHMNFDSPVYLNVTMTGVDLSDISDPSELEFVYFAEDGSIEEVSYSSMTVDLENGVLQVVNAQLNHFSRYGWAK